MFSVLSIREGELANRFTENGSTSNSISELLAVTTVFAIAALNCVVFYILSFLAVGGDGSSEGVKLVRVIGFGWIALTTTYSLYSCSRKAFGSAVLITFLTLPLGYLVSLLATLAGVGTQSIYQTLRPNTSEFQVACRGAIVRFISAPSRPVNSIAYDWSKSDSAPKYNHFTLGSNGRVGNLSGGIGFEPLPPQIAFTETRCCRYEGHPGKGMQYLRRPREGSAIGIQGLTADALVTFRSKPVGEQSKDSRLMQFDVEVTDRRDSKLLASMRYLLDEPMRRGCGETSPGVMDERSFVLRAIGLN